MAESNGNPTVPEDMKGNRIFVGGLELSANEEDLKQFFGQFGEVVEANIMKHTDKMTGEQKSRGFGFVTFAQPDTKHKCLGHHEIKGKMAEIKDCVEGHKSEFKEEEERKVFVGGLPATVTTEALRDYFSKFDPNLVDAEVKMQADAAEPSKQKSRGFGFVTFSHKDVVAQVIAAKDQHYIDGKWVDVKQSGNKGGDKGKGFGKGKGKGKDGGKGFGKGFQNGYGSYGQQAYGGYGGYQQAAAGYGGYGAAPAAGGYGGYGAAPAYGQQPAAAAYGQQAYGQAAYGQVADMSAQYAQAAAAQQPAAYAVATPAYGQQQAYGQPAAAYGQPAAAAAAPAATDAYAQYGQQPAQAAYAGYAQAAPATGYEQARAAPY